VKMLVKTIFACFLGIAGAQQMLSRHTTVDGGNQAQAQTSTDYLPAFCTDYTSKVVVAACGQDSNTGGNPSPFDPATPMNLILRCSGIPDALICSTTGNAFSSMCCEATLDNLLMQCSLAVRVFNGGSATTTLITAMLDVYPGDNGIPPLMTTPNLPAPPQGRQTIRLLGSLASLAPVKVPFNDRRRVFVDLPFIYCGASGQTLTFGITGTAKSAESEVYVCQAGMTNCGSQINHGTDYVVTVFHNLQSLPLQLGSSYFVRIFSFGHDAVTPDIEVVIATTTVTTSKAWAGNRTN